MVAINDTAAKVRAFILWLQGELHLDNFDIEVVVQDDMPLWCGTIGVDAEGMISSDQGCYKAQIWICPVVAEAGRGAMRIAAHEMLHLWMEQAGFSIDDQGVPAERSIVVMEPFLVARYESWIGENDGD